MPPCERRGGAAARAHAPSWSSRRAARDSIARGRGGRARARPTSSATRLAAAEQRARGRRGRGPGGACGSVDAEQARQPRLGRRSTRRARPRDRTAHDRMAGDRGRAGRRARQACRARCRARSAADEGLARAARARGGTLVGEGLEVDPKLRRPCRRRWAQPRRRYLVDEASVEPLAGRRGTLACAASAPSRRRRRAATAAVEAAPRGRWRAADRRHPARPAGRRDAAARARRLGADLRGCAGSARAACRRAGES